MCFFIYISIIVNKHATSTAFMLQSLFPSQSCLQFPLLNFQQTTPPQEIDKPVLGRYAVMGTLIYSPILFNWYKWLDRTFPGTTKKIILRKLLLDQFVLTPPLLVIFFTGMSIMEMKKDKFEECKEKFLPTFQRSCLFWLPAQTVNFLLIPPHLRVVYMGCASFLWVNILCYVKRQKLTSDKSN